MVRSRFANVLTGGALLAAVVGPSAFAGRTTMIPPITITDDMWDHIAANNCPQAGGANAKISFSNLGANDQTISVTVKNQKVGTAFCYYPAHSAGTPGGSWTLGDPNCYANSQTPADLSFTLPKLVAGASTTVLFGVQCDWAPSGQTCSYYYPGQNASGYSNHGWDLGTTEFTYSFSLVVSVAEDRGAVVASAYGQGFLWLGYAQIAPIWNAFLNGGRPF